MSAIADSVKLSPNFTALPVMGRTVIIHATRSGIPGFAKELEATLNWFSTPGNPSSHWVVGPEGQKVRVVRNTNRAAHAQEDNDNSWGIEVCQGVEDDGFTEAQYIAVTEICRDDYMHDFNVPPVHAKTSSEPGFIGHQETEQGRRNGKSDPGKYWDWDKFLRLLTAIEPIQDGVQDMVWARWKDRPENVMFRTYLLWTDASGLKSRFVPNFEEHQALEESQVAGPLLALSIETLRQFKCSPDPAA